MRAAQKSSLLFLPPILVYLGYVGAHVPFPAEEEILLYSTESLKLLHCRALKSAKESIHLRSYGLNDPHVLRLLDAKRDAGLDVQALCDARGTRKTPNVERIKKSGLFHAKTLVIDHELALLGSANFTTSSLLMHQNLVLAIRSPRVARFIEEGKGYLEHGAMRLWFLPEPTALPTLIATLNQAQTSIEVKMFTFTHPELIAALTRAAERGVRVDVYLDRNTRRPKLPPSIHCHIVNCPGLYHHKCALIDKTTLVLGSANWTKAAFTRNTETLMIVDIQEKLLTRRDRALK